MLEVQKYLGFKSYEDLENELGIRSNIYVDRVVLNYSQIDSSKHNPIVKECRGLILGRPNHDILSRSFDRFFNYGEDPDSNRFDIAKSVILDKIDGSMINVYYDGEKWECASRSMAFAEGLTPGKKRTYKEIFIEAIGGDPADIFNKVDKNLTIIFELVSPETRIVTPYQKVGAYLLDVRNKVTGAYLGTEPSYYWTIPDYAKWIYPKGYEFDAIDDCILAVKKLPAMEEGYVATQNMDWRIKIKNPAYLAIAHLRMNGEINEKRIILLVMMQDQDEYLNYFPDDIKEFQPYMDAYKDMMENIYVTYEYSHALDTQKEYALAVKDSPAKSILFAMRKDEKTKVEDFIDRLNSNSKVRLLKAYLKKETK